MKLKTFDLSMFAVTEGPYVWGLMQRYCWVDIHQGGFSWMDSGQRAWMGSGLWVRNIYSATLAAEATDTWKEVPSA